MREAEFRDALRSGLGRVILHARAHDVSEFREITLNACLHSYAVDPQTEGTRVPYIQQLINCTAEPEFYRDRILRALPGHGDDWDAVHRFRLASYFAMDGDSLARGAMYQNFCPGPRMAEAIAVSFVEMDGCLVTPPNHSRTGLDPRCATPAAGMNSLRPVETPQRQSLLGRRPYQLGTWGKHAS